MPMVQAIDTMISVCEVNGLSGETFEMQVPEHARISGLKGGIARETSIPTVFQQLLVDNVKVHDNELVGQRRYQLILSLDTACSILEETRCKERWIEALKDLGKLGLKGCGAFAVVLKCYTRDDDEFLYQDPTYYTEVMKTISLIAKIIWCQQWKARTDVNTQRKLTKLTEVILQ